MQGQSSDAAPSLYTCRLESHEIRLLQVASGHDAGAPLICSLSSTTRDAAPSYAAISYVWGDVQHREDIICDGLSISISRNLFSVILEYRARNESMPIWVDALCINQADIAERTSQVRVMRTTYKDARIVIVWLGPAQHHEHLAIDGLKGLYQPWANYNGVPLFKIPSLAAYDLWLSYEMREETVEALAVFLRRPWFSRIWIVQEILSAASLVVWSGPATLDTDMVLTGGGALQKLSNMATRVQLNTECETGLSRLKLTCAGHLASLRDIKKHDGILHIWELLMLTRYFDSTEPRDKVFALVGLAHDVDATFVDYSLNESEVATSLSKLFLTGQTALPKTPVAFLSCIYKPTAAHLDKSPSWVVDWTALSRSLFTPMIAGYPDHEIDEIERRTSTKIIGDEVCHPTVKIGGDVKITKSFQILQTNGFVIDQLENAIDSPATLQQLISTKVLNDLTNAIPVKQWHDNCLYLVSQQPSYVTGEAVYDVFWRALVCDRKPNSYTETPPNDSAYLAWIRTLEAQTRQSIKNLRIDRIHQVGIFAVFGASSVLTARYWLRHAKYRWLSWIALFPINFVGQFGWSLAMATWRMMQVKSFRERQLSDQAKMRDFEASFSQWSQGRKFGMTRHGYMGWFPTLMNTGDCIVSLRGTRIPFAMKPCNDGWKILGDVYLHGAMGGFTGTPPVELKIY